MKILELLKYPRLKKFILVVLTVAALATISFIFKMQYLKKTEPIEQVYERHKEIRSLENVEMFIDAVPEPEQTQEVVIKDRYLLFEHFDLEDVEFVQGKLSDLVKFTEEIKDFDGDLENFYESRQLEILEFLGELSPDEFKAAILRLKGSSKKLQLLDDFKHAFGDKLIQFSLTSIDGQFSFDCTYMPEYSLFTSVLISISRKEETDERIYLAR